MRRIYLVYTLDKDYRFELLDSRKTRDSFNKYSPGAYHHRYKYTGDRQKYGVLGPYETEEISRAAIEYYYEISESEEWEE